MATDDLTYLRPSVPGCPTEGGRRRMETQDSGVGTGVEESLKNGMFKMDGVVGV